jgi:dienelactone hydrolase
MGWRGRLSAVRGAWGRLRADLRPGPSAWRGAAIGTATAITVALIVVGQMLVSGRGPLADAALAVVAGWIAIGTIAGVLLVLARVVRGVPPRLRALGIAAIAVVGVFLALPVSPGGVVVAAVFIVAGALVGAGVAATVRRPSRRRRSVVAVVGLLLGVAGIVAVPVWLAWGGAEPEAATVNPPGPYPVTSLHYGSGQHPHRPEFGEDVDVVTTTVDGTAFLANWSGRRGTWRTNYWGFGPDELPLNGHVWLPEGGEPGPLVLIVHSNHAMEVPSDQGYAWLGEDLASRGYVVASIDQNFLNLSTTRGLDLGDENDARAWLLLEHLRRWRAWQEDPASPLHGTVDLDRIALIGHSRGGEAVAHAASFDRLERYPADATVAFDAGFGIDAVIAIAPVDGQYQPAGRRTPLHDVSYLVLHGGRDGDVSSFEGLRQYARTTFSGRTFAAKAAIYLEDANHGQFNTVWGRRDMPGIAGRTLETATLVPGEVQRRDARAAIVALLDASLHDDTSGLALLRDGTDPGWTGATRVITRYEDSTDLLVAGFDEDLDPATASLPGAVLAGEGLALWREEPAPLRWVSRTRTGSCWAGTIEHPRPCPPTRFGSPPASNHRAIRSSSSMSPTRGPPSPTSTAATTRWTSPSWSATSTETGCARPSRTTVGCRPLRPRGA